MRPEHARIGLIVQCQGGPWYDMAGKTGRLYRVERIIRLGHPDRVTLWVSEWCQRDTRRILKSGRVDGYAPGWAAHVLEPIGDGADYEPHAGPPVGYAGEALPLAPCPEALRPGS